MTEPMTRREFAGLVTAGTVLSAASETSLAANHTAAAEKSPPISPVEALVQLVLEKYPDARLDEAALDEIRTDFRHFLSRSHVLSSFPLTNADEPGFVFAAWRADRPAR